MKHSILDMLQVAENQIKWAIEELNETPERSAINNLINACESIDAHYRSFCAEFDLDYGTKLGTTYEDGISIEYYIEADWWHDVSQALRILRSDELKKEIVKDLADATEYLEKQKKKQAGDVNGSNNQDD